ncbi:hypothetical protein FZC35_00950 [Candidatus Cytomitobacter indipagum]|uniref:Uncharacterized protein n=1 Tax=Candidatus Cytomitobacter indipagum TaxID=2601575 RepID=A0A5C0UDW2_9PROT|nr:hypothetical protein [Candidatus Cytomitobacter indipagum]QEK37949.1 hypothetical protein FZC35_00950 [Candidatus Cytomitobacter indipagum]
MIFSKKLAILFAYFTFFNHGKENKNTAKMIVDIVDDQKCYQSRNNLDKCILNLTTSKKYKINRNVYKSKTNEVERFIKNYRANERYLKKSNFIGDVYPESKSYDVALLVYDPNQGIEVFREKVIFLNKLYEQGYRWDVVEVIVSSKSKNYGFEEIQILQNKYNLLNIRRYNIKQIHRKPLNDEDIAQIILEQMELNIGDKIEFYSHDQSLSQIMRDWSNESPNTKTIDIQINPMIPYYKARWNEYYNHKSNKIEVVGSAGITNKKGRVDMYYNAELILSSIGLYYKYANKYRF